MSQRVVEDQDAETEKAHASKAVKEKQMLK
jgi:hypothetical protein